MLKSKDYLCKIKWCLELFLGLAGGFYYTTLPSELHLTIPCCVTLYRLQMA